MKKLVLIAMLAFFFGGCETNITDSIDLGEPKRRLVAQGGINLILEQPQSVQEIYLSESTDYFETNVLIPITNASVTVENEKGQAFTLTASAAEPGWYRSEPVEIQKDLAYTMTVDWEGQRYTATEKVAPVAPIDTIYQQFLEATAFEDEGIKIIINFTDVADEVNYYFWEVFTDGVNQINPNPGNQDNLIQSDLFYDGATISGYQPNEEATFKPGQVALVKQYGISQRYFDYLRTLFEQTTGVPGFLETPPAALRGNLVNTTNPLNPGLGYFRVSEVSVRELTIQ